MDVMEKLIELLHASPHLDVVKGYKGNDCTFEQGAEWLSCYDKGNISRRVTHWMPLPQPPKGE